MPVETVKSSESDETGESAKSGGPGKSNFN